jgi:intein/homing endonuclease
MVIELKDSVAGTAIYVNPDYVVSVRPDPEDPVRRTEVKLRNGETLRVVGDHPVVAGKLGLAAA